MTDYWKILFNNYYKSLTYLFILLSVFIFFLKQWPYYPLEDSYYYILEITKYSENFWQGAYTQGHIFFIILGFLKLLMNVSSEQLLSIIQYLLFFIILIIGFWRIKNTHPFTFILVLLFSSSFFIFHHFAQYLKFSFAFLLLLLGTNFSSKLKFFYFLILLSIHPLISIFILTDLSLKIEEKNNKKILYFLLFAALIFSSIKLGQNIRFDFDNFILYYVVLLMKQIREIDFVSFILYFFCFFSLVRFGVRTRKINRFAILFLNFLFFLPIWSNEIPRINQIGIILFFYNFIKFIQFEDYFVCKLNWNNKLMSFVFAALILTIHYQEKPFDKLTISDLPVGEFKVYLDKFYGHQVPFLTYKGVDFYLNYLCEKLCARSSLQKLKKSKYKILLKLEESKRDLFCRKFYCYELSSGWVILENVQISENHDDKYLILNELRSR